MKKEKKASVQKSVIFKRRRLQLREDRKCGDIKYEVHEGATYETGIETNCTLQETCIQEIPAPLTSPSESHLFPSEASKIVFDLETTGFGMSITECKLNETIILIIREIIKHE